MKTWNWFQSAAVLLATFALVLPRVVLAAGQALSTAHSASANLSAKSKGPVAKTPDSTRGQNSRTVDISLGRDGSLRGQLVSSQGHGIGRATISLAQQGRVTKVTRTDASGRYVFRNVRSGVYLLQSSSGSKMCRVWNSNVAPPEAIPQALLVEGQSVVRGNVLAVLGNPWVLGLLAAAAIAVPLVARRKSS